MKLGWQIFWAVISVLVSLVISRTIADGEESRQSGAPVKLPDTQVGARVQGYLAAFNSGSPETMRAFLADNFTAQSLEQRPVDVRLQVYQRLLEDCGGLDLRSVDEVTDTSIGIVTATRTGGWLRMLFTSETASPHKLIAIRLEPIDPPAGFAGPPLTEKEALEQVGALMDSLARADRFSGTALIGRGDTPVFTKAVGYASLEYKVPNRLDTKFNLGSINKLFTKVAIAQLIEQGKVQLDGKLGTYLPDYPNREAAARVTVAQLINMTSGIGDFFGERFDKTPKNQLRDNNSFLPLFADEKLHFEPGSQQEYSNGGYIVLGAIIERAANEDYYEYVRKHVFEPAGMINTDSYEADAIVPNLAMGYTYADEQGRNTGRLHQNVYTRPARASACGGGYSTAEDLFRFVTALKQGKLLGKRYTVWMYMDQLPEQEPADLQAAIATSSVGWAGGSLGINAVVDANNETGYTVVVMANYDPPVAQDLGRKIRGLLARAPRSGEGRR